MLCRASSDSALYASITATPSQDPSSTTQQGMSHAVCCFAINHFTAVLHNALLVLQRTHSCTSQCCTGTSQYHSTHSNTSQCCISTLTYTEQYFTVFTAVLHSAVPVLHCTQSSTLQCCTVLQHAQSSTSSRSGFRKKLKTHFFSSTLF